MLVIDDDPIASVLNPDDEAIAPVSNNKVANHGPIDAGPCIASDVVIAPGPRIASEVTFGPDSCLVSDIGAVEIELPAGFVVVDLPVAHGEDVHEAGRRAAAAAIAIVAPGSTLAYDGARPIVSSCFQESVESCVSITHTRGRAIAIAARCTRLGVDLVDHRDIARIERLAPRYLADERALLADASETRDASERDAHEHRHAQCFAAKEAALKALGLGLLDGGAFDRAWPVRVVSLDPPRLAGADLTLVLGRAGASAIAVVYR